MTCRFCGGPNDIERVAIGYRHCVAPPCVAAWRRERNDEAGLVLVNQHKQGPAWIYRDQVPRNSMRRDNGA